MLPPAGDVHRDPDGASAPAAPAHGVCADLTPASSAAGRAHALPAPLLQDPQQGPAPPRVPPHPPTRGRQRHQGQGGATGETAASVLFGREVTLYALQSAL